MTRRRFAAAAVSGSVVLAAGLNKGTAVKAHATRAVTKLSGLDDYCQTAIADWQVPALHRKNRVGGLFLPT
jgi:hypothetical protein